MVRLGSGRFGVGFWVGFWVGLRARDILNLGLYVRKVFEFTPKLVRIK